MQHTLRLACLASLLTLGNWLGMADTAQADVNGRTYLVDVHYAGGTFLDSLGFDFNSASNVFGNFRCLEGTGSWFQIPLGSASFFYGSYNSQGTALYGYYTGIQINASVIGIGYSSGLYGKGPETFVTHRGSKEPADSAPSEEPATRQRPATRQ
ncbi:hypothetical protein GC163_20745 [bacterium]|nr:hypothetical protein [bacterium]